MKRIKPWMVAVTLALVAAGGATAVFFVADAQHDRDRADIAAWLRDRLPAANEAASVHSSAVALLDRSPVEIRSASATSLATLRRDRRLLVESPIPEILKPVTARYVAAIDMAVDAFNAAGEAASGGTLGRSERERYSTLWGRARRLFRDAEGAERDLVCRARLPQCVP